MSFKPDKCSVLRFTRRKTTIDFSYKLSGHTLQGSNNHKYLGITLSSDLKWNTQVDKAVSKANGMIGFLRRNLGAAPQKLKVQAYKSLVLPHIEYCSTVWDPHTKNNIQKLEAVQRRAARFILNDYNRESSVTAMLKSLDFPQLQDRRRANRLVMMHKIIHNNVDLPLEGHLCFNKRDQNATSTRNHNPLSLSVPFSRTNCFQKTFFPNTARDWNTLPYSLISIKDSKTFKHKLNNSKLD